MVLQDLLDLTRCVVDTRYADKAACLGDLAKRAATALRMDKATIGEALIHREQLGSTGLGNGIALPHARIPSLAAPFVMVLRLREPIPFEAVDEKPVDIVCLILLPANGDKTNVLACVARRLRDPATRTAIRKAKSAECLHAAMTGVT
jgi:PTS system nitrogen regulatory IIA component